MTFRLFSAIVLTVAAATPAAAQSADQPTGTGRTVSVLDAHVDLFGTLDRAFGSSTDALPGTPLDPLGASTGNRSSWGANSSLVYSKTSNRLSVGANLGASVRRVGVASDEFLPGYTGAATLSGPLGRRSEWGVNTSLSYGPAGAAGFLDPTATDATMPSIPLPDYGLTNQDQLAWSSSGSLSHHVSRRGTLSGTVMYTRSNTVNSVIDGPETQDAGTGTDADPIVTTSDDGWFQGWTVSGRYGYQVTRYLNWYAGYGLSENTVRQDAAQVDAEIAPARLHTVDLGVEYGRPLSFSRRTRIATRFGSSVLKDRFEGGQHWIATGNASLRHELGRTWLAQLAYTRDTRFVPTFIDPLVNSGVSARVGGNLTRRSALNLLTNYSSGTVGIDTGNNGFRMRSASVSYRHAILSQVAAYVEYFLFDFKFDGGVQLADPLFAQSRRHGVRVGVSIGTGLMGTRRRGPAGIGEGAQ